MNWELAEPQAIADGPVKLYRRQRLRSLDDRVGAVCKDRAAVDVGMYNRVMPKLRQLAAVGDSPVHILCPAHTLENCDKSGDHNAVVKLLLTQGVNGRV